MIKFRKVNDTGVAKKRNDKIQKIVVRFIENLRSAVWLKRQAEIVKKEQEKQSQIMMMYTQGLQSNRGNRLKTQIPVGMSNLAKRNADPNSGSGRLGLIDRAVKAEKRSFIRNILRAFAGRSKVRL
jgi:hypothetical protein